MEEPPQKRFKYTSYTDQIKNITLDTGNKRGLAWETEQYNEDTEQTVRLFCLVSSSN